MGFLARTTLLALVGTSACYSPDVRDCTVRCSTLDDCAGEQTCGPDGFCVSTADVRCAGTSGGGGGGGGDGGGQGIPPDAGDQVVMTDAGVDAPPDAPPDAPTHGQLAISISGKGSVHVEGIGLCLSGNCEYSVPLSASVTAHALAGNDFDFEGWTQGPCANHDESRCTFVPTLSVTLGARFRKDD